MNKPKMILFDSGGTLCVDVDYDIARATAALMPYVIKNPRAISADELYAEILGVFEEIRPARRTGVEISEWTVVRQACARNGITLGLDEATFERVFRLALTPVEMTPHIDELLDFLNANGYRTGVVSNTMFSGVSLRERHERLLPRNRFECFVASCDYAVRKPKKALFEIALAEVDLPAGEVWYCGDNYQFDVLGARGAGMFPVLYDRRGDALPDSETIAPDLDFLHICDWRELIEKLKEL